MGAPTFCDKLVNAYASGADRAASRVLGLLLPTVHRGRSVFPLFVCTLLHCGNTVQWVPTIGGVCKDSEWYRSSSTLESTTSFNNYRHFVCARLEGSLD
jgi:hypothetical protein